MKRSFVITLLCAAVLVTAGAARAADGLPPTVSILNPRPGTLAAPASVALRPLTNDIKVQVQVWDDAPIIAGSVQVGYYSGADPEGGAFTFTSAVRNQNYQCGANCGVYEVLLNTLVPGTNYFLYARASSADGLGESRQNRTGVDARYVLVRIVGSRTGTGLLLGREPSSQFCLDCHNFPQHSSQSTGTSYQNWQTVCLDCHTPHKTRNIYLVKESIVTPNSGVKTARLYNTTGDAANSFVTSSEGASTAGVCQVCHTKTKDPGSLAARWRNTGNADPGHYQTPATQRCTYCHGHRSGFAVGCNCHSAPLGPRRQVLGAGGDFNRVSHHVINYGSRTNEIVTMNDCLVCHDMEQHTGGSVRLKDKDHAGAVMVYNSSDPKTLEPFCLSCHDANGASTDASPLQPFSDGNVLGSGRNIAGNKIAGYWSSSKTVHRSGGLTCAGSGALNTGCHGSGGSINGHGSTSPGLLAQNMTNPIPPTQSAYNYDDYKLCFDCHSGLSNVSKEVVLGYQQGGHYDVAYSSPTFTLPPTPYYTPTTQTAFRDRYLSGDPRTYNDIMSLFSYSYMPLHNLHLLGSFFQPIFPSRLNWLTWNYRGDATQTGRITCTSCHNVHGTNADVRGTYDELLLTRGSSSDDLYTTLPDQAALKVVMQAYPMNCSSDCHGINGSSSYWYAPEQEWSSPAPTCNCHMAPTATRRQVLGSGGDFNRDSHHVINYNSRTSEVVTPDDCQVCHDMAQHQGGSIRLKDKDQAGTVIVYNPADPKTLEPFCLSCHDTNGASTDASPLQPFSDGNVLGSGRNIAGNKIMTYWTSSFTTHKNNGLTCTGTGAPNTGCHGSGGLVNGHGSASRGLLARNMTNPIPETQSVYRYDDYKICFDCHESYPAVSKEVVLGYRRTGNYGVVYSSPTFTLQATPYDTAGIQSLFRDRYIVDDPRPYNDIIALFDYSHMALHNLHLLGSYYQPIYPTRLNWLSSNYRGDPSQAGRITCTSCHNVHGTNTDFRNTHDELLLTRGTTTDDLYVTLPDLAALNSVMEAYPMNCATDCHGINGSSSYWYSPPDE